ncbi:sulfurtransferase [Nocardioides marmoriginsengisoli]|uniref:Sulfurtransferase n=1 Tax=Nocardioides marmoriginsengisoli TaxID=661483 RepID=A0A3N0CN34_9ACTN|nr:sulfurtransferase [Nocardioides marmoriginsengisoli]RNL64877.1 sulfurtransferase [Nocardioides marmoriginsengisoli]
MSVLISASELNAVLDDVTVLDVRYQLGGPPGGEQFMLGHVPEAQYVDLDKALASEPGPRGRHPLPDPARFGAAMRWAGVFADLPVVVYDDWQGRAAARAWWLLRHHGHPDVRVLDGGWSAWVAAGGAVETGMRLPMRGDFEPGPGVLPVIEVDDVLGFAERAVLVDARNAERYRGDVEPVDPVAGHVPGAVNVPTGTNLRTDGTFRSPAEIAALYAASGVTDGAEVGVYCGSGVTAAHDVLALAHAGIDAALYPGSWSEWVADPSRPVATGSNP